MQEMWGGTPSPNGETLPTCGGRGDRRDDHDGASAGSKTADG